MNHKSASTFLLFALLVVVISSAISPVVSSKNNTRISSYGTINYSGLLTPSPTPTPTPTPTPEPTDIYVGFRSNNGRMLDNTVTATLSYSIDYWVSASNKYKEMFPDSTAVSAWLIPEAQAFNFDQATDNILTAFDNAGVYVFLQVGDDYYGQAVKYTKSVDEQIDLVLGNYGHHKCVLGFGVCIESITGDWRVYAYISDAEATRWVSKVRSYNSDYKLYIKHFVASTMPPTARDGIIFVSDNNGHGSLSGMVSNFKAWGNQFSGADVAFAVGYSHEESNNDYYDWIQYLDNPPYDVTKALFDNIPNCKWVYWVNVNYDSLTGVFQPPTPSPTPFIGANLAPMPYGWEEWDGGTGEYLFIDYEVTHNGNPSLRMEADFSAGAGSSQRDGFITEPNYWIPVNPNDHIIFRCWMKLNAGDGQYNGSPDFSGARLGIDFYDNQGYIGATEALNGSPNPTDTEESEAYVHWGTTEWTLRTMEFDVLPTYGGKTPTGIIPWIQVMPFENTGYAWFADCELYINP